MKAPFRFAKAKRYARAHGFRTKWRHLSWIYEKNNLTLAIEFDENNHSDAIKIILSCIYVQHGDEVGEYGYSMERLGDVPIKKIKRYFEINGYSVKIYECLNSEDEINLSTQEVAI